LERKKYINDEALVIINEYFLNNYPEVKLEELWLHHCNITDKGLKVIAEMVRRYPYLHQLHLSHNPITLEGLLPIFDAVVDIPRKVSHHQHLYINIKSKNSNINAEGLQTFLQTTGGIIAKIALKGMDRTGADVVISIDGNEYEQDGPEERRPNNIQKFNN